MPVRRFNYTGRVRIEEQNVALELHETDDGNAPTFTALLNLAELNLPDDARVVITARRGRAAMRFDWGTVGNPAPPPDCRLTDVPVDPVFRVMVEGNDHQILALANSISPRRAAGRESLLWLEEVDLDQEVWKLRFDEPGRPVLLVNQKIGGMSAAIRQESGLQGTVLPEVFRSILTRALIVEAYPPDDDDSPWSNWLRFTDRFYAADFAADDDDGDGDKDNGTISEWIDGAVAAFTRERFHAASLYAEARR